MLHSCSSVIDLFALEFAISSFNLRRLSSVLALFPTSAFSNRLPPFFEDLVRDFRSVCILHRRASTGVAHVSGLSTIEATKNFDDKYLIGMEGQGSVYKVELPSGMVVAVKKLHMETDWEEKTNLKASESEIKALTEIRHRNIIKLCGYCQHSRFSFLVYKFLEGGSLDQVLSNDTQATAFDWKKKVNIVKGVANALSSMHHGCTPPIVHRDISSKNVLLDSEYEAYVSDFGTTKFLKPGSTWTTLAITYGVCPDYGSD